MTPLKLARGTSRDFDLKVKLPGQVDVPEDLFRGDDTLATAIWKGDDGAPLLTPATAWLSTSLGTYRITLNDADTAGWAVGTYRWQATATRGGRTGVIGEGTLEVTSSPGTAVDPPTYCTYEDMLTEASWIAQVQDQDTDQAGFVEARARARRDIDDIIVANYRGASVGLFGTQSAAALSWGYGGGPWRSLAPSQILRTYLDSDYLMRGRVPGELGYRPKVALLAAWRAISIVGLKQIGLNQQQAASGAMFYRMFLAGMASFTAEIDTNGDGYCEIPIPCGATNTVFT
jgi:hypothetical protein